MGRHRLLAAGQEDHPRLQARERSPGGRLPGRPVVQLHDDLRVRPRLEHRAGGQQRRRHAGLPVRGEELHRVRRLPVRLLEEQWDARRLPARRPRHDEDEEGLRRRPIQPRHAGALVPQIAPREGGRRAADRLAVVPRRLRGAQEDRRLRIRDRLRRTGQRLPGADRTADQQRRRPLQRRPEAGLRDPGQHRGARVRRRDDPQGLYGPGERQLLHHQRAVAVEGRHLRDGLREPRPRAGARRPAGAGSSRPIPTRSR